MFVASEVTKSIFLSVDPIKEKTNQHRTLHLDPQRADFGQSQWIFCHGCLKLYEHTLIGYIALSNGGWREKICIYDDISLNNTISKF